MLGNYLQQTTSADGHFQMHFFLGALRVKLSKAIVLCEPGTNVCELCQTTKCFVKLCSSDISCMDRVPGDDKRRSSGRILQLGPQMHDRFVKYLAYSKTCVKEHSAILLTFIKLPFVIKNFDLSILSGRLRQVYSTSILNSGNSPFFRTQVVFSRTVL